jgi:hypothetical protein
MHAQKLYYPELDPVSAGRIRIGNTDGRSHFFLPLPGRAYASQTTGNFIAMQRILYGCRDRAMTFLTFLS